KTRPISAVDANILVSEGCLERSNILRRTVPDTPVFAQGSVGRRKHVAGDAIARATVERRVLAIEPPAQAAAVEHRLALHQQILDAAVNRAAAIADVDFIKAAVT